MKTHNRLDLADCRFASARHYRALAKKSKDPAEVRYLLKNADYFDGQQAWHEQQARMFGPNLIVK
jgi:hypothetical protein